MARRSKAVMDALYEERRAKALRLSTRGRGLDRIAEISREEKWEPAPYTSRQAVWADIQVALKRRRQERNDSADEWIENENAKLDMMEEETWSVAEALHFVVNQGEVVYLEPEEIRRLKKKQGWARPILTPDVVAALAQAKEDLEEGRQPLIDKKPVLDCMLVLIKIAERRSKLNGHDAPVKKQVEVTGAAAAIADKIDAITAGILAGRGTLGVPIARVENVADGRPGTFTAEAEPS